ncbi:hypothetical protein QBC45DRAFT_405619 [Copromyces sp. CBS 386.78]|nr:hypothetical protein QBC45DRAFT_405619 [Copromyces sp. CBS 386.78]
MMLAHIVIVFPFLPCAIAQSPEPRRPSRDGLRSRILRAPPSSHCPYCYCPHNMFGFLLQIGWPRFPSSLCW